MVLIIDVGNTHVVLGIYTDEGKLLNYWRVSTDRRKTEDEYGMMFRSLLENAEIDHKQIKGSVIASVVPPLTQIIDKAARKYFGMDSLIVGPGTKTGVNVRYENPKEVGADRIAHAVGAINKYGAPAIVVDFGTATTFDAVSQEGDYLGGSIAPGMLSALDALSERTARLPRIELTRPRAAIGKTTVQSMQSGIVYGFAAMVDGLVNRIAAEMEGEPHVIATGGLAKMVAPESTTIQSVDPFLVLDGLYCIHRKNATQ